MANRSRGQLVVKESINEPHAFGHKGHWRDTVWDGPDDIMQCIFVYRQVGCFVAVSRPVGADIKKVERRRCVFTCSLQAAVG